MKLMLKKLLVNTLLFALLATNFAFFLPTTVRAQGPPGPWHDQNLVEWYLKVYDETVSPPSEIFGERYTAAQVNWIIWSILSWIPTKILGPKAMVCLVPLVLQGRLDIGACISAALSENTQNREYLASSSPEKSIASSIFADRPLSGITYVKNIFRKFKLIPEVKAQGFGFTTALDPILPMWRGSRDIAYTLFVFITIVFAFMIMFRVKISPQTVITVQSALPKLAVAIILVTFSYAIAGFLVDLMYVVIGLVALLSNSFVPGIETTFIFDFLTTGKGLGAFGLVIVYLIAFGLAAAIVIFLILGAILSLLAGTLLIPLVSAVAAAGVGPLIAGLILVLLVLLVLWHAIRITWMLLKAFTSVLLLTIFAPFQIAIGTLVPNFGFSAWVKSMVSSLAVFVVAGVLFVLSFIFLGQAVNQALSSVGFGGPVGTTMLQVLFGGAISGLVTGTSPSGWPPLISTISLEGTTALLFLGVSMVLFTSIPKAADIIKGMIEGRPFAFGTAIGQAVAPVGFAYGQAAPYRRISQEAFIKSLASRFSTTGTYQRLPRFMRDTITIMSGPQGQREPSS